MKSPTFFMSSNNSIIEFKAVIILMMRIIHTMTKQSLTIRHNVHFDSSCFVGALVVFPLLPMFGFFPGLLVFIGL